MQRLGVPALRIGEVGGDELRIMNDGLVLRSDVIELRQSMVLASMGPAGVK